MRRRTLGPALVIIAASLCAWREAAQPAGIFMLAVVVLMLLVAFWQRPAS